MAVQKGDDHWKRKKMLANKPTPTVENQKDTLKRHTLGMMGAVEAVYGPCFVPKCKVCYDDYGWLTKCICATMEPKGG